MKNRKQQAVILAVLLIVFYVGFFLFFQDRQKSGNESENDRTQEIVTELEDSSLKERSDLRILAELIESGNGEKVLAYESSSFMPAEFMGVHDASLKSGRS